MQFDSSPLVSTEWLAALEDPATIMVDCLTPELYRGSDDRHLWGQRSGHIPGAVNVPYLANIDPALADASAAERKQLLASGRSFTFSSLETLSNLYWAAAVRAQSTGNHLLRPRLRRRLWAAGTPAPCPQRCSALRWIMGGVERPPQLAGRSESLMEQRMSAGRRGSFRAGG